MAIAVKDAATPGDSDNGFLNITWRAVDVTLDNNYPSGGYPISLSDLGMARMFGVIVNHPSGFVFEFDHANNKLKAFRLQLLGHTHTENTAAAYTQNATTGAVNSAGLTGSLVEVTGGSTVLNGVVVRLFVMGQSD